MHRDKVKSDNRSTASLYKDNKWRKSFSQWHLIKPGKFTLVTRRVLKWCSNGCPSETTSFNLKQAGFKRQNREKDDFFCQETIWFRFFLVVLWCYDIVLWNIFGRRTSEKWIFQRQQVTTTANCGGTNGHPRRLSGELWSVFR